MRKGSFRNRLTAALSVMCLLSAGTCSNRSGAALVPDGTLALCGYNQRNTPDKTCIVDGDTLWLHGTNIRLKDFDTPESRTNICGGFVEIDLATAATDRLQELLNNNSWSIETFGIDGTGTVCWGQLHSTASMLAIP